ncbi:L-ectoine synthase-like [Branchiostoma floridae x Branchiostoma japonicum]
MIVRHTAEEPLNPVPQIPTVKGKEIVAPGDGMGYSAYEVVVGSDGNNVLEYGGPGCTSNHMYYCMKGSGKCVLANGKEISVPADFFMGFSSAVKCKITASEATRLFCVFSKDDEPSEDRVVTKPLSEVIGTDRDVDWGSGFSRRFLLRDDKFGVSVTLTSVFTRPETVNGVPMWYKNHKETAYYINGNMTYQWEEGKQEASFRPGGTAFMMNKNDPHRALPKEESLKLCVFYPALVGNEKHSFDGGYSVYGAAE